MEEGGQGDGVRGRQRTVEELLGPDHQRLGIAAGGEEAAGLVVPEQIEQLADRWRVRARATACALSIQRAGGKPRRATRSRPPRPGASPGRPASCASAARRYTWTPRGTRRSPRRVGRTRRGRLPRRPRPELRRPWRSTRSAPSRPCRLDATRHGRRRAGRWPLLSRAAGAGARPPGGREWCGPPSCLLR